MTWSLCGLEKPTCLGISDARVASGVGDIMAFAGSLATGLASSGA